MNSGSAPPKSQSKIADYYLVFLQKKVRKLNSHHKEIWSHLKSWNLSSNVRNVFKTFIQSIAILKKFNESSQANIIILVSQGNCQRWMKNYTNLA